MIYCVEVTASFNTANRRDNVLGVLTNYAAQFAADLFVPAQIAPYDGAYKGFPNALHGELRLRTQVNREQVWTDIEAAMTGPGAPTKANWRKFDAPLDEADPGAPISNDVFRMLP